MPVLGRAELSDQADYRVFRFGSLLASSLQISEFFIWGGRKGFTSVGFIGRSGLARLYSGRNNRLFGHLRIEGHL